MNGNGIDWSNYRYIGNGYWKKEKMSKRTVKVWIQGTCFAGSIRTMLAMNKDYNFRPADSIATADMILYTGGADVNPFLYGERKLDCTYADTRQDRADGDAYLEGKKHGILHVGICRGAQILNVLNGGTMWQDVSNHAGQPHLVEDVISKKTFLVSSMHHQGIILNPKAKLLAFCEEADRKISATGGWSAKSGKPSIDVEAFWYPETRSLGVQWHPEVGPKDCVDLFFSYVTKYLDDKSQTGIEEEVDRAVG